MMCPSSNFFIGPALRKMAGVSLSQDLTFIGGWSDFRRIIIRVHIVCFVQCPAMLFMKYKPADHSFTDGSLPCFRTIAHLRKKHQDKVAPEFPTEEITQPSLEWIMSFHSSVFLRDQITETKPAPNKQIGYDQFLICLFNPSLQVYWSKTDR